MRATWWVMGSMGVGAGLMYWVDPLSGRRRRAIAHDKALHAMHEAGNAAGIVARDMSHRTRGILLDALARMRREEVDDRTIEARVRSALGRVCSHPHAIRVSVQQGRVRLDGVILKAEHRKVLTRLSRVRGVLDLMDSLEVQAQAGNHPSMQGGRSRPGNLPEFLQHHWSPTTRFVAGLGGMSLLSWGREHRGILGMTSRCLGALLLLRGITNLELKRLTGVGAGRLAIEVHKDILIPAPVEEVFAFWRAMENFPRFMSHVEEVRPIDADRSHWRVKGPAGTVFEWDALITRLIPHQVLAWKSVEGAMVENAGIIHFEPVDGGRGTRLDIRLSYNPPAGALGHAFARLLGADPKRQLDDDLMRLKSLIESGKATGHETVSREQLMPSMPEGPGPQPVH